MPALIVAEYTDDGCSVYACSVCGQAVEARGQCTATFKLCPFCGVTFTHNDEANSAEARQLRQSRLDLRLEVKHHKPRRYWFEAWVPNTMTIYEGRRWFHEWEDHTIEYFYFDHHEREPKLKTGDDAYFAWGRDWLSYDDLPQPFHKITAPRDESQYRKGVLYRDQLVRLIRAAHGCPMRFGIVKEA